MNLLLSIRSAPPPTPGSCVFPPVPPPLLPVCRSEGREEQRKLTHHLWVFAPVVVIFAGRRGVFGWGGGGAFEVLRLQVVRRERCAMQQALDRTGSTESDRKEQRRMLGTGQCGGYLPETGSQLLHR